MQLTVRSADVTLDVDVTVVDPAVPIGEVFLAITGRAAGPTLLVDGWSFRSDHAVGLVPLHNGSVITDDEEPRARDEGAASLLAIAGTGSGSRLVLGHGTFDLGRGRRDRVEEPELRLEIEPGGTASVRRLGANTLLVDGEDLAIDQAVAGEIIQSETAAFRLEAGPMDPTPVLPLSETGRIPFQRPPRQLANHEPLPPDQPEPPKDPQRAQPFSWLVVLLPIPIGVFAALFFSPFFLVFMAMSPILTVGRWWESRRRSRADRRRFTAETEARLAEYTEAILRWRTLAAAHERMRTPDVGRLLDRARGVSAGLWERRADHDDFLHLTVGLGSVGVPIEPSGFAPFDHVGHSEAILRSVPIGVDLVDATGIGIVGGDDEQRRQVANGLITELAVNHGPADVTLALLVDEPAQASWDWAKWIPHLEDERGFRYLAGTRAAAGALLASFPAPDSSQRYGAARVLPSPLPVVVVDGDTFLDGSFLALTTAARSGAARAVVLAGDRNDLPAICSSVVEIADPTGTVSVTSMTTGRVDRGVASVQLDADHAASICRHLTAFQDPERANDGSELPQDCDLRSLIGGDITVDAALRSWRVASTSPRGSLGIAEHGLLELNLVDDGPHALIAGTTGSGKSELLRTLVASLAWNQGPDRLNFVLVDFKGGGAFDACARLPHTVGVVTDLDEHLAARALRCLKAELRYRERRLREAEVSDLRDYENPDDPLPRLVVIVDEFATLAAELPEFMTSLVDIAQRGRSLGIHVILATQRPSGVVDAKIRANTNLRISLRVQDDADSEDVIGDRRAARIDRRIPGRGYVRLGASELAQFQTAIVSRSSVNATPLPLRVSPFDLTTPLGEPDESGESAFGATDLELIADVAGEAARVLDLPPARVPWPSPLPPTIDAGDLGGTDDAAWSAPLGVVDLPDEQRTETFFWSPEVGNLAVFGTDGASTSNVLATLALGLARRNDPSSVHLYLVDFSGGGVLSALDELPHVGAVITPQDDERMIRVVDRLDAEIGRRSELARASGVARIEPGPECPLLMLGIANYGALVGFLEETGQLDLGGRFERIVRDGPGLGIHVVATANHERGIPTKIVSQIESRLIMRLADANAYLAFGLRSRDVPDLGPGRAVDVTSGHEVQIATYHQAAKADRKPPAGDACGPQQVAVLGTDLPAVPIAARSERHRSGWKLGIGISHADLGPVSLDLHPGTNVVISGGSGSGKTTALRMLALSARQADPDCRLVVLSHGDEEWPDTERRLVLDELADGRRTLVLVDSPSALDDDLARELETINADRLWLVVAARPEMLQSPPNWLRRITTSRTGLLLQPQPDHGDVIRTRLPMRSARTYPPGRGFLVNGGLVELIQVGNAVEPRAGATPDATAMDVPNVRQL